MKKFLKRVVKVLLWCTLAFVILIVAIKMHDQNVTIRQQRATIERQGEKIKTLENSIEETEKIEQDYNQKKAEEAANQ